MKSSFEKLKRFALHKSDDVKDHHNNQAALSHLDGLALASQEIKDIRNCYDSLLSAAAATANSAYEFSESLLEMGNCLLAKTALNEDGECCRALSMLGKVQLEIRKLVDSYRSHIILTITKPSESLLNELRKVEEMKLQSDEKREVYDYLLSQYRDKGRSRGAKGDSVTSLQLQTAREEYDDVARLCVFRVESLKQGQFRSLFTQAARHHAAQLNFFRRAVESLEAVEPHVKTFAEKQHIEYQLSGLGEVDIEDEEANSYESYDDGELSFDYGSNKQELDNALRNSIEADVPNVHASVMEDAVTGVARNQGEHVFNWQARASSHSAPIHPEKIYAEKTKDTPKDTLPAVKKSHTHVLPTPADAKGWTSKTSKTNLHSSSTSLGGGTKNLWHSSPLETERRKSTEDNLLGRNMSKAQNPSVPLPRPLAEGVGVPQSDLQKEYDYTKIKRLAFSGPLASRIASSKPSLSNSGPMGSTEPLPLNSGLNPRTPIMHPPTSINVSHSASPPLASSPRISELHELPRPPGSLATTPYSAGVTGHSTPQVNRKQEVSPTNRSYLLASKAATALPLPPLTVLRSFSIPSSNQRAMALNTAKLVRSPKSKGRAEEVTSPPLTPLTLSNIKS